MDLRGVGDLGDTVKYLAGGIEANQQVSRQTLRLVLNPDSVTFVHAPRLPSPAPLTLALTPNPAENQVWLSLEKGTSWKYVLSTMAGVRLQTGAYEGRQVQLNVSRLVAGVYVLEVWQGESYARRLLQVQ
jgi:hypothetical protein